MPFVCSLLKFLFTVVILSLLCLPLAYAKGIIELTLIGPISPVTADYIIRSIAKSQDASLIILEMDTQGGLNKSMHQIISAILTSKVPVVSYVTPPGSNVSNEGILILYASTLVAMAPNTSLGVPPTFKNSSQVNHMVLNNILPYFRDLAQLRGRDGQLVEKSLLQNGILNAVDALKEGAIEIVAIDKKNLLEQLQGLIVIQDGLKIQLETKKEVSLVIVDSNWRHYFIKVITTPTVAYVLLLFSIYGIFFELINPGFRAPGLMGVAALLVLFFAMPLLPINYAGLGLIIFGVSLLVIQAFSLNFGLLGISGTMAFIIGSFILMDSNDPAFQINSLAIWTISAINIFTLFTLLGLIRQSRKKIIPPRGVEKLLWAEGRALGDIDFSGKAIIRGEIWSVHAAQRIKGNKRLKVIMVEGLQIEVAEI